MSEPPRYRRRLLIRADAGRAQGSGHVMRSLAVAEAARAQGIDVWLSADLRDLGWLQPWVADLDVQVVSASGDAPGLAGMVRRYAASAVLLDHYSFEPARSQVNAAGAILVNIEDEEYGRRPADIVVDYSLGADAMPRPDDGSAVVLRGVSYAPLRDQVRTARAHRARFTGNVRQVAVLMGGTDHRGLRPLVEGILDGLDVSVASAPPGLGFLEHVAKADAVITAAGSSAYEMCCLGMPIGLVQVADNQSVNVERLVGAGAATGLGVADDIVEDTAGFAQRVRDWLADPTRLDSTAQTARALLDGDGAQRIAKQIAQQIHLDSSC